MMKFQKKIFAFTLAEILIVIAVLGIIGSLTIPVVLKNYKAKTLKTEMSKIESQIKNIAGLMYADGEMVGSTTGEFMNKFNKYAKLSKVCDAEHMSNCFMSEIKVGDDTVPVNDFKTPASLGQDYKNDDNMAGVFIDGTSFIMSFDPDCKVGKDLTSCMHMLIALDGKSNNTVGSGIVTYNASLDNDKKITLKDVNNKYGLNCSESPYSSTYCGSNFDNFNELVNDGLCSDSCGNLDASDYVECICDGPCKIDATVKNCYIKNNSPQ